MNSPFTEMLQGKIPCHVILESEKFMAILEPRPIRDGHAVVFPKKEEDYIFNLDDQQLSDLMIFCKSAAKKIERVVPCAKVGIMAAGLKVRHAHIHLVPIQEVADLDFSKQKPAADAQLAELAKKIRATS